MITITPSASDLPTILRTLIAQYVNLPRDPISVTGTAPNFETLVIELTDATPKDRAVKAALPQGTVARVVQTFFVRQLSVVAKPFGTPDRSMMVEARGANVGIELVETTAGETALRLAAASGRAHASLDKAVLRAVLSDEASRAAVAHGVAIKEIIPTFSSSGPRSLAADVVVKAKKGFLPTATLRITGRVSVDENLTGRLHNLAVQGEGIGGNVAAGFIRPTLSQLEGKSHSLLALPLDNVRIADVRIIDSAAMIEVEVDYAS